KSAAKPAPVRDRMAQQGPDIDELDKIKLQDNPTEQQVRDYISFIRRASEGQTTWSETDPQVRMYIKVGSQNLPLLVEALQRGRGNYHLQRAVIKLADDAHKQLILDALPDSPTLVTAVRANGWEAEAKPVLLAILKDAPNYLPNDFIEAVADYGDPETYADLANFLVIGGNTWWTYSAIRDAPGIQLDEPVKQMWLKKKRSHEYERRSAARVAIDFGHVDALGYLIDWMAGDTDNEWEGNEIRRDVLRVVPIRGSDQELRDWFNTNKDKLTFNASLKKYEVGAAPVAP
ncbi:MAG TPA: hypothetical protein VIH35_02665, partial [Kiritimatiellia bacterium]